MVMAGPKSMKYAVLLFVFVLAAAGATLFRYGSLDPCVWMETDLAEQPLLVPAEIRARILVDNFNSPDAAECLTTWYGRGNRASING